MQVTLQHSQTGLQKTVKIGFSWTTLFFGLFPALFRGDIKWAVIMLILAIVTFGIAWLVFPFVYNKIYIKGLMEKGYVPADEATRTTLAQRGIPVGELPT
jgi:hypothetical protein